MNINPDLPVSTSSNLRSGPEPRTSSSWGVEHAARGPVTRHPYQDGGRHGRSRDDATTGFDQSNRERRRDEDADDGRPTSRRGAEGSSSRNRRSDERPQRNGRDHRTDTFTHYRGNQAEPFQTGARSDVRPQRTDRRPTDTNDDRDRSRSTYSRSSAAQKGGIAGLTRMMRDKEWRTKWKSIDDHYGKQYLAILDTLHPGDVRDIKKFNAYVNFLGGALDKLASSGFQGEPEAIEACSCRTRQMIAAVAEGMKNRLKKKSSEFNTWTKSTICNTFGKLVGHADGEAATACVTGLVNLAAHLLPAEGDEFTAQSLALMSSAYGKLLDVKDPAAVKVGQESLCLLGDGIRAIPQNGDHAFSAQELALVSNAYGKLFDAKSPALVEVGREVLCRLDNGIRSFIRHKGSRAFSAQGLALMSSAYGKLLGSPDPALVKVGQQILCQLSEGIGQNGTRAFTEQNLALMSNAYGKLLDAAEQKLVKIGQEILCMLSKRIRQSETCAFTAQELALMSSAYGKLLDAPDQASVAVGQAVLRTLGERIGQDDTRAFAAQELALMSNAYGKLLDAADTAVVKAGQAILCKLSERIVADASPSVIEQHLALMSNAYAKLLDAAEPVVIKVGQGILCKLSKQMAQDSPRAFTRQELALMCNAYGKLLDAKDPALVKVGQEILCELSKAMGQSDTRAFSAQHLALISNAYGKLLDAKDHAVVETGQAVLRSLSVGIGQGGTCAVSAQHLTLMINAYAKLLDAANPAAVKVGQEILCRLSEGMDQDGTRAFTAQDLALMSNAYGKLLACDDLDAAQIGRNLLVAMEPAVDALLTNRPDVFIERSCVMISRGYGALAGADHADDAAIGRDLLVKAAQVIGSGLDTDPDAFTMDDLTLLLSAYSRLTQQSNEAEDTVPAPFIALIAALHARLQDAQAQKRADLDELGYVCVALARVARNPALDSFRRRQKTFQHALVQLQPILDHKIERYLSHRQSAHGQDAYPVDDPYWTARPAETFCRIAAVYAFAVPKFGRGVARSTREALSDWVSALYKKISALPEFDEASLGLEMMRLAEALGADDPALANDLFLAQHRELIAARMREQGVTPMTFDIVQAFAAMDRPLARVAPGTGRTRVEHYTIGGHRIDDAEPTPDRYTVLARLTQGQFSTLRYVAAPNRLDALSAGRLVRIDGVEHMCGVFGGSMATRKARTAGAAKDSSGWLPAIDLMQVLPPAPGQPLPPLQKLMELGAPYREDWIRLQRELFTAPTLLAGTDSYDYVLEGRVAMQIVPLNTALPGCDLVAGDGVLYIKESHKSKFGWSERIAQRRASRNNAQKEVHRAFLPSQALQQFPQDIDATVELLTPLAEELMIAGQVDLKAWVAAIAAGEPPPLPAAARAGARVPADLYRHVTTANSQGVMGVAVPTKERLYLPDVFGPAAPHKVLIGLSPYVAHSSLHPFPDERLGRKEHDDPTYALLSRSTPFQLSMAWKHAPGSGDAYWNDPERLDHARMVMGKGVGVALPDDHPVWQRYPDADILSAPDNFKTGNGLPLIKGAQDDAQPLDLVGALITTDVFENPIGVPIAEQKGKLGGDYDGDLVLALVDRPQLHAHAAGYAAQQAAMPQASGFKPKKARTEAMRQVTLADGTEQEVFEWFRIPELLAARASVIALFTGLQNAFKALSAARQEALAKPVVVALFEEGLPAPLKQALEELTEDSSAGDAARASAHTASWNTVRDRLAAFEAHYTDSQSVAAQAKLRKELASMEHPEKPKRDAAIESLRDLVDDLPVLLLNKQDSAAYIEGDARATLEHLLIECNEVAKDGAKAPGNVPQVEEIGTFLQRLFARHGCPLWVPYTKSVATRLQNGKFDPEETLQALADNPTQAALLMKCCVTLFDALGAFDQRQTLLPEAGRTDRKHRPELQAVANDARRRAVAMGKTVNPLMDRVVALTGGRHRALSERIQSDRSLKDRIAAHMASNPTLSAADAAARIKDVLRYVVVYEDTGFDGGRNRAFALLREHGCVQVGNTMQVEAVGKAVDTTWRLPDGPSFAIRFHNASSYRTGQVNHTS